MTSRARIQAALVVGAVVIAMLPAAFGEDLAAQGRAVFERHKEAVVTVRGVISLSHRGEERERKTSANGTIIDPDGLSVLSLTFVDPFSLYGSMGDKAGELASKVVSLHMILPDGKELPAEVVLRDKDLDLVFVRPTEKPEQAMAYVDIAEAGSPELLSNLAVIMQLGEVARRAHGVFLARVESIVEKPRLYYVIGEDRGNALVSSPAFTLDGKLVGIGAMRAIRRQPDSSASDSVLVVIVPVSDVREAVEQVPSWP